MNDARDAVNQLIKQVEASVIGQGQVVRALVIALLANGHVLLEGLPGTAKTRSVKTLASVLNVKFGRIQFTPDLLPSDVTGTEVYQEHDGKSQLHFQPGPLFNNIVLADEVNRAPAKVQAALLEAMGESTITVGGQTHQLPELFMVLATQNPVEQEGTYPLPEAQMDRFIVKVDIDYPQDETELDIVRLVRSEEIPREIVETDQEKSTTIDSKYIFEARQQISVIHVSELVERYIVGIVMATRDRNRYPESKLSRWIEVGASPRASIALDKCARVNAWIDDRDYVTPDDVRLVLPLVIGHRLTLSYDALADSISRVDVVNELLNCVDVG